MGTFIFTFFVDLRATAARRAMMCAVNELTFIYAFGHKEKTKNV